MLWQIASPAVQWQPGQDGPLAVAAGAVDLQQGVLVSSNTLPDRILSGAPAVAHPTGLDPSSDETHAQSRAASER
jgi:hypothetical protein